MLSSALRCFLLQWMGLHYSLTIAVTSFWVYTTTLFPFWIRLTHQWHALQLLLSFRFDCTRSGDNCDFSSTVLHQKHELVCISDWILHCDSGSDYYLLSGAQTILFGQHWTTLGANTDRVQQTIIVCRCETSSGIYCSAAVRLTLRCGAKTNSYYVRSCMPGSVTSGLSW